MGIYIKGMKMPKKCLDCIWLQSDEPAGLVYCTATDPWLDISCVLIDSRHDDCPLVEVPAPHGRLIDEDAVGLDGGPYEYAEWVKWALQKYLDAPTVIPATEEGE